MLVLTRHAVFGAAVSAVEVALPDGRVGRVLVLGNPDPGRVKLGFEFPPGVGIDRGEVAVRKRAAAALADLREALADLREALPAGERAELGVGHLWKGG